MILLVIATIFHLLSGGLFLTPRNLYNLILQTSVVAILASGMTLIIVARHIDLSVGSLLGLCGMVIALLQIQIFPSDAGWNWPLTIAAGLLLGTLLGMWQGFWVAYLGVPSFVVTLGGLLVFRGLAFEVAQGKTLAPFQTAYQALGGGPSGSLGETGSWLLYAVLMTIYIAGELAVYRHQKRAGGQPGIRNKVIRAGLAGGFGLLFVMIMNAYNLPRSEDGRGIPAPAIVLLLVVVGLEFLARLTTFGRYIYAVGGHKEAARLSGIPVKRTIMAAFGLMGFLCGLAAVLQTARLNAGTAGIGELMELSAIAAAVIGGVSLAGGRGNVTGAVLGALVIQSMDSGMVLIGATSSQRMILIGLVLMMAVFVDRKFSRRDGDDT